MAEAESNKKPEKLGSRRGGYAVKNINVEYSPLKGYYVTYKTKSQELKEHPELKRVEYERGKYNEVIKKNKEVILQDIPESQKKAVTRWINQQVYGTKFKKGTEIIKPELNQQKTDALKEMQEAYKKRKPLDDESKKLRKKLLDTSGKKLYDTIRYAKKEGTRYIYINNQRVYTTQITPVKEDYIALVSGKPVVRVRTVGYKLPNVFKEKSPKFQAQISNKHYEEKYILKERKVKRGITEALVFKRDNRGIYTEVNMKRVFNTAEKKIHARIIYVNNVAMTESDFYEEDGKWYIQPYFYPEQTLKLYMPVGGEQIGRLSFSYNVSLTYATIGEERKVKEEGIKVYKEITTNVIATTSGELFQAHLVFLSANLVLLLHKVMNMGAKFGAEMPVVLVVTKFKMLKNTMTEARKRLRELSQKNQLLLTPSEREELARLKELAKVDAIIECYDGKIMDYNEANNLKDSTDELLIIGFRAVRGEGKNKTFELGVGIKTPAIGEVLGIAIVGSP